jgi:hypothetical protein
MRRPPHSKRPKEQLNKLIISVILLFVVIVLFSHYSNHQTTIEPVQIITGLEIPKTTPSQTTITTIKSIVTVNAPPTITPVPSIINNFKQSPKSNLYTYLLSGDKRDISFTTYGALSNHLSMEEHSYHSDMEKEVILELLVNEEQDEYFKPTLETIKKFSPSPNNQAKIAISLVQHIPYDWNSYYNTTSSDWYYPYETMYNNRGMCGDKSILLAYLLNKLDFDTVLFEFSDHMAVGIKSSQEYSFYGTGYAFIESTAPTIITYVPDKYYGGFKVTPNPHLIHIAGGKKTLELSTEYQDAIKMKQLEGMGLTLDQYHYSEWSRITNYYDLQYRT